jgi:hypothetical protein
MAMVLFPYFSPSTRLICFLSTAPPGEIVERLLGDADDVMLNEPCAEDLHQRRPAGAVLADDRMDIAGAHADRNVAQNLDRAERTR